jgi:hypothetical protein
MSRRRYAQPNPSGLASISTDTWILVGLGSVLLGTIAYAIYELSEAKDVLSDTSDQIGNAAQAASGVGNQIGQAAQAAQNVSDQVQSANQTVTNLQNNPSVIAANSLAAWWNSL